LFIPISRHFHRVSAWKERHPLKIERQVELSIVFLRQ